ncbi:MAG TPA: hypothetical protein VLH37_10370 [Bacteroidales bacterium]|nr:hypothetical protein [Bacteroidales bacterium]
MTRIILILTSNFLICVPTNSAGQNAIRTESETHIFWQENRRLTKEDFQGSAELYEKSEQLCEEINMCTMAYVGLWGVLDTPRRKRLRGRLPDKIYFAPAFDKTRSYIVKDDSIGVEKQQVVFDIVEVAVRFARWRLKQIQDSIGGSGIKSLVFMTVKEHAKQVKTFLIDEFTKDVYING